MAFGGMNAPESVRDIIMKFSGHHPMVERADKSKNCYIGVRGW